MPTDRELAAEPDPEAARIGAHLRTLRREHHLSLEELAAKLGRAHSALSKVERGLARPATQLMLVAPLAEIYGITTQKILDDLFPDGRVNIFPGVELALANRCKDGA